MNALILAAGFGTRLEQSLNGYQGPHQEQLTKLVKDKPKGLVQIAEKPIVTHQLEQLRKAGVQLNNIYVQTNQKYYHQYLEWAMEVGIPGNNVFNNGVTRNEDRKEQTQDLLSAIAKINRNQPLFLFASDTLVYNTRNQLLDLSPMVEAYEREGFSSVVAYYKERDASKHGVMTVDEHNQLTSFIEKPQNVISGLVNASVYLFSPYKLREMQNLSVELLKCKNPLELVSNGFKVVQASHRMDIGTIDDVFNANSFKQKLK